MKALKQHVQISLYSSASLLFNTIDLPKRCGRKIKHATEEKQEKKKNASSKMESQISSNKVQKKQKKAF